MMMISISWKKETNSLTKTPLRFFRDRSIALFLDQFHYRSPVVVVLLLPATSAQIPRSPSADPDTPFVDPDLIRFQDLPASDTCWPERAYCRHLKLMPPFYPGTFSWNALLGIPVCIDWLYIHLFFAFWTLHVHLCLELRPTLQALIFHYRILTSLSFFMRGHLLGYLCKLVSR